MAAEVKVDDRVWQELRKKIGSAAKSHVKVGILSSHGGSSAAGNGDITLAELMAIHEYGSPAAGIPARAPLRRTFTETDGAAATAKFLEKLARQIINERVDVPQALDILGQWAVASVKSRIRAHLDPPNKPATIKAKGSSTPLIDTSQLLNSLTYEVKQ